MVVVLCGTIDKTLFYEMLNPLIVAFVSDFKWISQVFERCRFTKYVGDIQFCEIAIVEVSDLGLWKIC